MALGTGLDRRGEIALPTHWDLNPEPSNSQQVVLVYKFQILISVVILSSCRKSFQLVGAQTLCDRNAGIGTSFFLYFFLFVQQPPVGQGFLIHEASRSHTMAHHSR